MSTTYVTARANDPENDIISQAGRETKPCADLNLVIGDILRQVARPSAVIRCDELPVVQADPEKLRLALLSLLRFIFRHPPVSDSIFLYIKAEELKTKTMNRSLEGERFFKISFQTNSQAELAVFSQEEAVACSSYLAEARGTLKLNTEPGSGWLFILEVPGKLNK